jgi:predicted dehydrogenase
MSEASQAPLQVGLVGYGLAGSAFHAPLIDAVEGLELAAVVTNDAQRREAVLARYPQADLVGSIDELLDDNAIGLVVVASPNRTHVPYADRCVEARRAVVVDKPLATTAEDVVRLRDTARAAGSVVVPFHNRRWDGDLLTVRRLLETGEVGQVERFESRFERWRPQVNADAWRESGAPDEGGGLLLDLGTHLVDQALVLLGPATHVYAEVRTVRDGAEVDDDVFVALEHESGGRSHLWASAAAADLGPRMRVLGSRAAYVKYGLDVQEQALRDGRSPREADWGTEPEAAWGVVGTPDATRPEPTLPGCYQRFYEQTRDAVAGAGAPPVGIDDALAVARVLDAARLSAAERQIVPLDAYR